MMKYEFEKLYGHEVSYKDYEEIIEPMYNATSLDKSVFVKLLDKKRFALRTKKTIILEIRLDSQRMKETCTHFHDFETEERIIKNVDELEQRFGSARIEYSQLWSCYYPSTLVLNGEYIKLA